MFRALFSSYKYSVRYEEGWNYTCGKFSDDDGYERVVARDYLEVKGDGIEIVVRPHHDEIGYEGTPKQAALLFATTIYDLINTNDCQFLHNVLKFSADWKIIDYEKFNEKSKTFIDEYNRIIEMVLLLG